MTVSAIYRPAPGEAPGELGPNDFTAGSDLTLNCSVEGHSGGLSYSWSVTGNPSTPPDCTSCDIDTTSNMAVMSMGNSSTLVIGRPPLLSYYAGMYICTAIEHDRPGSRSSDDFSVSVVGEFITMYIHVYIHAWRLKVIIIYHSSCQAKITSLHVVRRW